MSVDGLELEKKKECPNEQATAFGGCASLIGETCIPRSRQAHNCVLNESMVCTRSTLRRTWLRARLA